MSQPIDLIYLIGTGHSGSTLLDLILGSHSRVEGLGEVKTFAAYLSADSDTPPGKRLCTCGQPARECQFWRRVLEILRADTGRIEYELTIPDQAQFEERNYRLFRAVLEATGKSVICDSSKNWLRVSQFVRSSRFRTCVVHLVRDGRAVAYSLKRRCLREGKKTHRGQDYYDRLLKWTRDNLNYHRRLMKHEPFVLLRYEDFVRDPQSALERILRAFGLRPEPGQLDFWNFPHHNLGGNQMRRRGKQPIRADMEYLQALSAKEWWLGTALAWRALRRFGYPLRRKACTASAPG